MRQEQTVSERIAEEIQYYNAETRRRWQGHGRSLL